MDVRDNVKDSVGERNRDKIILDILVITVLALTPCHIQGQGISKKT